MAVELKQLPTPLTALDGMSDAPVIPVIVLNNVSDAVPMAQALVPIRSNVRRETTCLFTSPWRRLRVAAYL